MSDSVKYLSGKLSYQGDMLEARIKQAKRVLEVRRRVRRRLRFKLLKAEMDCMRAVDTLRECLAVKALNRRKKR